MSRNVPVAPAAIAGGWPPAWASPDQQIEDLNALGS